ncbi:hypothetical protein F7731_11600 [Cytobacillus depressus]|uniref:SLH domain-containing protein n=1 Tax=Cytobacillus depressus TaxID=1602942 RepID=A0A6L3V7B3_9BACI|nr:S-layer homology domain-containing protein [Cytobacillus depressus]KAB2336140.1 hypothetical protein F7731_11600 [Cytobacillus depressus]
MNKHALKLIGRILMCLIFLVSSLGFVSPYDSPTAAANEVEKKAEQIHYSITGPDSVTFDWVYGPDTIQFGETNDYDQVVQAGEPIVKPRTPADGVFREAKITGLKPNTTYHYTIDDGQDYTFRTAPTEGSAGFTIVTMGDTGDSVVYPAAGEINDLIAALNPDLFLGLGDFTYADQSGLNAVNVYFNDVMKWSREVPFMPIWGNHEWQSSGDDLTNYIGRFDLPNAKVSPGLGNRPTSGVPGDWYWFDYGNTRFIAYPEPYSGAAWLDWGQEADEIMEAAKSNNDIKFIVTFGHRPTYSSGSHGSNDSLANIMEGLAKKHPKFVLNLMGHDHHYERTDVSKTFGVHHVLIGTGGSDLYSEKDSDCGFKNCTSPPWSAERFFHFGVVKLVFEEDEIKADFVCGPAHKKENVQCNLGEIVDSFTIESRVLKPDPTAVMEGAGTEEDPYIVLTAQDLYNIRNNTSAHYQLGANIDLTFFDAGDGKGWLPIDNTGGSSTRFLGSLDGNGFIINGLTIKRPDTDHNALIGYTGANAKIKNVALENVYVEGKNFAGALVSYQSKGSGFIKNSYATGTVKGIKYVGGLGGHIQNPVSDSFARVDVTGTEQVGGLFGKADSSVNNTYSTGNVVGTSEVGGLIGVTKPENTNDSYWDLETSGQTSSAGGTGKTTAEMKQKATYEDWDFAYVWQIDVGKDYPLLSGSVPPASSNSNLAEIKINGELVSGFSPSKELYEVTVPYSVSSANITTMTMEEKATVELSGNPTLNVGENTFVIKVTAADQINTQTYTIKITREEQLMPGSGTEKDPYTIKTVQDLEKMRLDKNAYYVLNNNLDLTDFQGEDGKGWRPIGELDSRFAGTFDGQGHIINGLWIDRPNEDFSSLFGYGIWGSSIKNIGLTNVNINGKNYTGGIVGYMSGNGFIRNSFVTGQVNGSRYVGGLAGATGVSVSNSYVQADVTGNDKVGGLVGNLFSSSSSIPVTIDKTYYTGTVKAKSENAMVGGFIADISTGDILNSYWNIDKAGQTPKECGYGKANDDCGISKTTEELKQKSTYVGWDFDHIWEIEEGNDYPKLRAIPSQETPTEEQDNSNGGSNNGGSNNGGSNNGGSNNGGSNNGGSNNGKLFADVPPTHWAYHVIGELASKQIINGTSETTFDPKRPVTRAEFTSMLVRLLKISEKSTITFSDITVDKWYADSISSAAQAGIVNGKSKSHFDPDGQITRQEMVTMLIRAYEFKTGKQLDYSHSNATFNDFNFIASWARNNVTAAAELGLIQGPTGLFVPQGITLREEAAQAIYNLLMK